jgi:N-acetylglutamate synthase-like GNAT family acetyltransferase
MHKGKTAAAGLSIRDFRTADFEVVMTIWRHGFLEMVSQTAKNATSHIASWGFIALPIVVFIYPTKHVLMAACGVLGLVLAGVYAMTRKRTLREVNRAIVDGSRTDSAPGSAHFDLFLVAEYEGVVIGCVGVHRVQSESKENEEVYEVKRLSVDNRFRRFGAARELMSALEVRCASLGNPSVPKRLFLLTGSEAAKRFYENIGYERSPRRPVYEALGLSVHRFEKKLTTGSKPLN